MIYPNVVFITGAGKGIGRAVVLELLSRSAEFPGLSLFLTSRTLKDLEDLKAQAQAKGVACASWAQDLSEDPLGALKACLQKWKRIDAFVHCAGVGRFGNFLDLTHEDLNFVLKTNVEASFLLAQAVYREMKNQEKLHALRGQIQWVTSVAAETAFPQSAIYCMSKFAQQGLLEVLKLLGREDGIRILEVKPGATITPMWGKIEDGQREKMMPAEDVAIPMVDALLLSAKTSLEVLTIRPLHGDL